MAFRVLVVSAHPDDETLGCGGTIARWAQEGAEVMVAFLSDGVGARGAENNVDQNALAARREAAARACKTLGVKKRPWFGDFPDNRMDTVALLSAVQQVESCIESYKPDTVLTHQAGDVNIDHQRVHQAVITACRPQPGNDVRRLLFFEVASSTEWQPPGSSFPFVPNTFVNIAGTLEKKLDALRAYEHELQPWPHPRSIEAVSHQARWRGATAGMEAAEAFILGRELI